MICLMVLVSSCNLPTECEKRGDRECLEKNILNMKQSRSDYSCECEQTFNEGTSSAVTYYYKVGEAICFDGMIQICRYIETSGEWGWGWNEYPTIKYGFLDSGDYPSNICDVNVENQEVENPEALVIGSYSDENILQCWKIPLDKKEPGKPINKFEEDKGFECKRQGDLNYGIFIAEGGMTPTPNRNFHFEDKGNCVIEEVPLGQNECKCKKDGKILEFKEGYSIYNEGWEYTCHEISLKWMYSENNVENEKSCNNIDDLVPFIIDSENICSYDESLIGCVPITLSPGAGGSQ